MTLASQEPSSCPGEDTLARLVASRSTLADVEPVLAHLDGCRACRAAVAGMVAKDTSSHDVRDESGDETPARGTSIGRYLTVERLGQGGMGIVMAAYDPELDRKVALKLVRPSSDSPGAAQLAREARALARAAHPNVVTVHDVGYHGDQVYVVMELVRGVTLRPWLSAKPRRAADVVAVLRQVSAGLRAAHQAGVVHRDIKPENILVDDAGKASLTDFGLARLVVPEAEWRPEPARLAGTLRYMAPEQLRGEAADERSDQFSFGVTIVEALSGSRPFEGRSRSELLQAIEQGPPVLRWNVAGPVPPGLTSALSRALQADPAKRWPNLDGLLSALTPKRSLAARIGVALVVATALGAATGLAVERKYKAEQLVCSGGERSLAGVWDDTRRATLARAFQDIPAPYALDMWHTVQTTLDEYASSWTSAYTESCTATRVRKVQSETVMDQQMACLNDRRRELEAFVDVIQKPTATTAQKAVGVVGGMRSVSDCLDARTSQAHRTYVDPVRSAKAADLVDRINHMSKAMDVGDLEPARAGREGALADARELGDRRLEAEAQLVIAGGRKFDDAFDDAETALLEALWTAEGDGQDDLAAGALVELITMRVANGKPVEPRDVRHLEAFIERLGGTELSDRLWIAQAYMAYRNRELDRASTLAQQALDGEERAGRPSSRVAANCHIILAGVLRSRQNFEGALAHDMRQLSIVASREGAMSPSNVTCLFNLALVETFMDRVEDARAHLERALEVAQASGAHRNVDVVHGLLGLLLREAGDWKGAREQTEAALAQAEQTGSNSIMDTRRNLAQIELHDGHFDRADQLLQAVLPQLRHERPGNGEEEREVLTELGRVDLARGRAPQARKQFETALAGFDAPDVEPDHKANAMLALAETLAALHVDAVRARRLAEESRAVFARWPHLHALEVAEADAFLATHPSAEARTTD